MDSKRIREAYLNKEPGRDLLFAHAALQKASHDATAVLGQSPTSLDSFCEIIHQLDAISERLKATARVMSWTNNITLIPAEKSDTTGACN
jgi:hypothetical protein